MPHRKLLKEYPGTNPLQPLHHPADILVRTVRQKNVYVIACDLAGDYLQLMFQRYLPNYVAHTYRYYPREHRFPIFGYPYQVHLQIALRVRAYSIASHAPALHEILLRLKARGFNHPQGDTNGAGTGRTLCRLEAVTGDPMLPSAAQRTQGTA
jgi:hypothetical protein